MSDDRRGLADVVADLRVRAAYYAALSEVGLPPRAPGAAVATEAAPLAAGRPLEAGPATSSATAAAAGSVRTGVGAPELAAIREDLGDCRRCKLAPTRRNIVFGQGNPQARLLFVGEAPGADEDEQGLAFVGRAGQLLTDIIEKGFKLKRQDVYIANILKCRPPGNRNPEQDEVLSCGPFLERQVAAIRPHVIVALGKFAAHWLLKTAEPITRLRGRMGTFQGIPVMPTYHPAYLLRNPSAKKDVWEDVKTVLGVLEG